MGWEDDSFGLIWVEGEDDRSGLRMLSRVRNVERRQRIVR